MENLEKTGNLLGCQVTPGSVEEKLLAIAAECANLTVSEVLECIKSPDWSGPQMYNWRRHVQEPLQSLWLSLSAETRLALFVTATDEADSEDWDSAFY